MTPSRGLAHGTVHVGADLTRDEVEFGAAVHRVQRQLGVLRLSAPFVLHVARQLGYRKIAPPRPVKPYGVPS